MSVTDISVELRSHLESMTIDKERGVPFRSEMLELVYGNMEYVRSVFGPGEITRDTLIDYFDNARTTWSEIDYTHGRTRNEIVKWCRSMNIKPLHYYAPMGTKTIWFKDPESAFLCRLKFGI
jgi:hypothetical protein